MEEDVDIKEAQPKSSAGEIPRATRDWLLILLTASASSIDAVRTIGRGREESIVGASILVQGFGGSHKSLGA